MKINRGHYIKRAVLTATALAVFTAGLFAWHPWVSAGNFLNRQLTMSGILSGQTGVTYELKFDGLTSSTVGSLRVQFCSNSPLIGDPCVAPSGMDTSGVVFDAPTQLGNTGFNLSPQTDANNIVLSRTPAMSNGAQSRYRFSGITNPSTQGSFYARIFTYPTTDASGPSNDASGLAFDLQGNEVRIQTYVPPYLLFCIGNNIQPYDCSTASGNYVDFGNLSTATTATGQTRMLSATNAKFGYILSVEGSTLTSGNNIIPALASPDVSRPGVSQFGMNLRLNTTPSSGQDPQGQGTGQPTSGYNTPNMYKYVPGDTIASNSGVEGYRLYTVNYIINRSVNQPPGVYVTTLNYIALASF